MPLAWPRAQSVIAATPAVTKANGIFSSSTRRAPASFHHFIGEPLRRRSGKTSRTSRTMTNAMPVGFVKRPQVAKQRQQQEENGLRIDFAVGPGHGFDAQRVNRPEQCRQRGADREGAGMGA